MSVNVRVGTSGFAYKEWKGSFYPKDLKDKEMLRYYAERLGVVEINNTFYRMPKAEMLEGWAALVPENFVFVLKAPQKITHQGRLEGVEDAVEYFIRTAGVLGARLGALLFQLPPFFKKDAARLGKFLAMIPRKPRVAFEFRNHSWYDEEIFGLLRDADAALCVADFDESEKDVPRVVTAGWGYLRLRAEGYSDRDLEQWRGWIDANAWRDAFVFFKHEDKGEAATLALRFAALGGR